MIKDDNKPVFLPTFGNRPSQIVGRDNILEEFEHSLQEPIGSRERCRFYSGQRGMGKTALLLEFADRASAFGYIPVKVTAYEGMNEDIIETIQREGASCFTASRQKIKGATAGAFGFSFGLTFSEEAKAQFGFRSKLTLLCDELAKHNKGILILVDEARTSKEMRELAVTYQHLVGEEKNVAIVMAGLPYALSGILNDEVLTFLNRAKKTKLGFIRTEDIYQYFLKAFKALNIQLSDKYIRQAAEGTHGFPYMMQLIGYYLLKHSQKSHGSSNEKQRVEAAVAEAKRDLDENVFAPILAPLSDNDRAFLYAMSEDEEESRTSDICAKMGRENSFIQPYRARLIDAGIIESPRTGSLIFSVPYLAEYLRDKRRVR